MSNAPFYVDSLRWGNKYGNTQLIDGLAKDGLTDVYDGKQWVMRQTCAPQPAAYRGEEQMLLPLKAVQRSQDSVTNGRFTKIIPVEIPQRKGAPLF